MATHSNILAWESLAPRSLVGYSPWIHRRVRHDLVTKQQQQCLRSHHVLTRDISSLVRRTENGLFSSWPPHRKNQETKT